MLECTGHLKALWFHLTRVRKPTFLSYDRPVFDQVYEFLDCCSWGTGIMMGAGVFMYLPIIIKYVYLQFSKLLLHVAIFK